MHFTDTKLDLTTIFWPIKRCHSTGQWPHQKRPRNRSNGMCTVCFSRWCKMMTSDGILGDYAPSHHKWQAIRNFDYIPLWLLLYKYEKAYNTWMDFCGNQRSFFMWFHKRPSYPCLIQVEEASFKRSWNTLRYLTPAIAVSVMYDIASKKHSFTQTYASEYVIWLYARR